MTSLLTRRNLSSELFSDSNSLANHHGNQESYLICGYCSVKFSTPKELNCHVRSRMGCGQQQHLSELKTHAEVLRKSSVKSHHRIQSDQFKHFTCEICSVIFITSGGFNTHNRVVHGDARIFSCAICSLTSKTSGCLSKHSRVHTGQRPFKCEI